MRSTPFDNWAPFFNDAHALSLDNELLCHPELFDSAFFNSEPDKLSDDTPASLLGAEGHFLTECWMEEMAQRTRSMTTDVASESLMDDVDLISFKSTPHFKVHTPIQDIPDEVITELLRLPNEPALLCPTIKPHHDVDLKHFLRTLREKRHIKEEDIEKIFQILFDTGCSVSCTGFKADFHGQLAIGDFGHVNTADGKAKIEGFGIV